MEQIEQSIEQLIITEQKDKSAQDIVYFINNHIWTFDPRPDVNPHDIHFTLYPYQEDLARGIVEDIRKGTDLFIEKSRDMGCSWLILAVIVWMWLYEPGFQALLGSKKEQDVDNGLIDSLFGKIDYMLSHLVKYLLPEGFDDKKHRTYMKLVNPVNGNSITGESANKNFARHGRYTIVLFDEFAFWPFSSSSWQAAGDSTKCRVAITTPPNEPSYAKAIRFSDKIKVISLHWRLHPKKDQAWYDFECSRRTEDEILHELDISWEYSSSGRPYPEADKCPFGQYPYDPELPLYVSWDLGLDGVAINWYQPVKNSDWYTLVEAYEFSDKVIDFSLPFFQKPIDAKFIYSDEELELIEQTKYWKSGIHFGDPSGKQRHVESGVSPYDILRTNGITVQTNDRANDFATRKEETKKILMRLRVNETPRTKWAISCVKSARYPKRDEMSQSTSPVVKPVHDWTSHHRTSLEFFAVNVKDIRPSKPEIIRGYKGGDDVTGYGATPIYEEEDDLLAWRRR